MKAPLTITVLLAANLAIGQISEDMPDAGVPANSGKGGTNYVVPVPPSVPEIYFKPLPVEPISDLSNAAIGRPVPKEIRGTVGGAIADFGPSTVVWPTDIGAEEGIRMTLSNGKRLAFRPAYLVLADRATGENYFLASLTNAIGMISSASEVVYSGAFVSEMVTADVRYEYNGVRDSFEQYVTLRSNFGVPEGVDSKNLRLECWTEWLEGEPEAMHVGRVVMREGKGDLEEVEEENVEISFGAAKVLAHGRAFSVGAEDASIAVQKSWAVVTPEGSNGDKVQTPARRFLIEAVDYLAAKPQLSKLGKAKGQASLVPASRSNLIAGAPVQKSRADSGAAMPRMSPTLIARISGQAGFVVDYCIQGCVSSPYGLISWWQGENNFEDVKGVNAGTGFSITNVAGRVQNAWGLLQNGAHVSVPNSVSLNFGSNATFSIEGWIKAETNATDYNVQTIVDKRYTPDPSSAIGYALYLQDGRLAFQLADAPLRSGGYYVFGPAGNNLRGAWHHIAVTVNKGAADGIRFYVDGVNVFVGNPTTCLGILSNSAPFLVGKHAQSGLNAGFTGVIDELSIYDRTLIAADVQALYNAGSAGKCGQCIPCTTCIAPLTSALAGWWPGDGTPADIVGTNHVMMVGTATYIPSMLNGCFSMDGNGYAYAPTNAALNVGVGPGFSIEAWVKPMDIVEQPLFEWSPSNYDPAGAHLWANYTGGGRTPGALFANLVDTSGISHDIEAFYALTLGNWTHVAVTYDTNSGVGRLYANGNVVAERSWGTFRPKTALNFYLGCRPQWAAARFKGNIDEPALYNRALTIAEVQAIYNAGARGKCKVLAPSITQQPVGVTVLEGKSASLCVVASGTAPLTYTWYKGANTAGSGTCLNFTATQVSADGYYHVVVSNSAGSVTSTSVRLQVIPDSDLDGMPDQWEIQYFGGLGRSGTEDYDKDGVSNEQEYRNGTNPLLQGNVLQVFTPLSN